MTVMVLDVRRTTDGTVPIWQQVRRELLKAIKAERDPPRYQSTGSWQPPEFETFEHKARFVEERARVIRMYQGQQQSEIGDEVTR